MIRPLEKEDVRFYNEVRNECREWLHDDSEYTHEEALGWFTNKGHKDPFFIYELNGKKIGYFRTSHWTKNSCFVGMDIHEDFRGKGLAKAAYAEFFLFLREAYGIETVKLNVLSKNKRAHNLYKRLGFAETSRSEHGSEENISMKKRISL